VIVEGITSPARLNHFSARFGGEAFDLLQLLNTGHQGRHQPSTPVPLSKRFIHELRSASGVELPYRAIKTNIGSST
jgi:Flp pilus assembly CpaF family ATPase